MLYGLHQSYLLLPLLFPPLLPHPLFFLKVIANMTVGKDVSTLFTDVVNCIQTDNLELKKLVYLYLVNYAKSQPEFALLAVNTFVKDANDPNPLIRALAIRTMGCIRVEKITEYLCEPLSRCLRDEDPYVRKTAAVCVAKLYDISPDLVEDRGFIEMLRDLIGDANPTVVSNSVAALSEIAESSGKDVMKVTTGVLHKLLAALNECTEWGQVFILDSLASYTPTSSTDADGIIERVTPRLQHANSAVVMSALKVVLKLMDEVTDEERLKAITKKLSPPLVSLLNSEPEMQYVALRNINLIVLKRPKILESEVKVFFCKYNDPIYVKMEKLEIIIRLSSDKNVDQVLLELKEYASEVDVDFVRRSVRAIGRCAIKLERAAERCINVLLELIQTKVNYVVQESIVVIKDIFRKYPNRYESVIGTLCENLENLDEPEAKASMIWIIGEYAERIDNADELLESFLENFQDEPATVQQQLLTATVKLFIKAPEKAQETVQKVLNMATEESDNPDLRDRGYIYWRLLSSDPEAARAIVLSTKAEIGDDTYSIDSGLLDTLIGQISSLASIYHKPPESFIMKQLQVSSTHEEEEIEVEEEGGEEDGENGASSAQQQSSGNNAFASTTSTATASKPSSGGDLLDLMDDMLSYGSSSTSSSAPSSSTVNKVPMVSADVGHGVFISGAAINVGNQISIEMDVGNTTATPVKTLAIQFNKNAFGLAPVNPTITLPTAVSNGSTASTSLALSINPQMINPQDSSLNIQTAIKNMATEAVFYFTIPVSMDVLFTSVGSAMDVNAFATNWKSMDESLASSVIVNNLSTIDQEAIKGKLAARDVVFMAQRDVPGQDGQSVQYYLARTASGSSFFIELMFKAGMNVCKVTVKSSNKAHSELCKAAVHKIIQ